MVVVMVVLGVKVVVIIVVVGVKCGSDYSSS